MMAPSRRRALIIATGSYDDPKLRRLRAPAADAQQLAAVLRDPDIGDFEVDIAQDCDEGELRRRIARFFQTCGRDDVLLTHVSGHGIKDARGALFLAASDTEIDLLDATAISAVWLDEQMTRSLSRRKLLLLDCCFSGKFPFGATTRAGAGVEVEERLHGRGRAVITASNSMEYAYEGDQLSGTGQPSYFTAAIVEALRTGEADRDQDRWISVDELYDYVYDRVKERSPNQTPSKQIALEGPLYVARSNYKRPIQPATLDRRLLDLLEHPFTGARLGAIEELARLLKVSNPSVALAARQALEKMRNDDSRTVAERAEVVLRQGVVSEQPSQPAAHASAIAQHIGSRQGEGSPTATAGAPHEGGQVRVGAWHDTIRSGVRHAGLVMYEHHVLAVTTPWFVLVVIGAIADSDSWVLIAPFFVLFMANIGILIAKAVLWLMKRHKRAATHAQRRVGMKP